MSKLDIVDFHSHFLPEGWEVYRAPGRPLDPLWARIGTKISDINALISDSDAAGIAQRVIGVALSMVAAPDADFGAASSRLNDDLAETVARHPDRLFALATVDAFGGETAATEARRAIIELKLSGLFLDSAKGDRLIDAPEARPVLRVASELGVPVFLHPINPEPLSTQLSGLGRLGTRLSRGTINAAAAISLVTSGVFEELPDLRVVITALGVSALALTGPFGELPSIFTDAPTGKRRHLYIDIMPSEARFIRFVTSLVGADHVLTGSDWPILGRDPTQDGLAAAFEAAGLSTHEAELIASRNALELLKVHRGHRDHLIA
ncbi:putative TIM-barrel fold metal-dependent hydrolase [Rhizobium mesoamericanum]|uniref:amidohydrolase family protein n=1 Tax=Rhizobium mesoamericanum TaxID=1079800 RepID=UPI002780F067|nr:amidohydrolase family protein [Rhizobium mesoamericanum]MDQ0561210.1 putative TIM-barrel fold metal-dependent hydrolase [Rhizobium mesoamericanum]